MNSSISQAAYTDANTSNQSPSSPSTHTFPINTSSTSTSSSPSQSPPSQSKSKSNPNPNHSPPTHTHTHTQTSPINTPQNITSNPSPSPHSKPCTLCHTPRNVLIRCQIDDTQKWHFICTGKCWESVSGGKVDGDGVNANYRYGGMWKNKHEAVSAKIKGRAKVRNRRGRVGEVEGGKEVGDVVVGGEVEVEGRDGDEGRGIN